MMVTVNGDPRNFEAPMTNAFITAPDGTVLGELYTDTACPGDQFYQSRVDGRVVACPGPCPGKAEAADAPIEWPDDPYLTDGGEFRPPVKTQRGPYAKTERFPCTACGGTGKYRGVRLHQQEDKCFACGGKGWFLTSPAERAKRRQQAAASKAKKIAEARAAFDEQYPGLAAFVADAASWSPFAGEMAQTIAAKGFLTEGQARACMSMRAKVEAKRAEKRAAREAEARANAKVVDLSPIREMFERAKANGYKRPVYRAAGLVLSRAPDEGRNPGAIYVKAVGTGEYLGKLIGNAYSGKPAPGLDEIAADPRGAAVRYGMQAGVCACCGRELSDPASIKAGIGPVCAEKWGF